MTSNNRLSLTNPADVAALVPYLLGYHPEDRLVILALQQSRLHFTVAAHLPYTDPEAAAASHCDLVAGKDPDKVILLGYGDHEPVSVAVDSTTAAFASVGIPVLNAFRVHDGRIWHLHCTEPGCEYHGSPFQADSTIAAAHATYHGLTAAADIDALAAQLDPVTGREHTAMTFAYHRATRHLNQLLDDSTSDQQTRDRIHTLLDGLLTETSHAYQHSRLPDDRAALLNVLLGLGTLRDRAIRHIHGDDLNIRAWTDLTRRATPESLAGPATMLAAAALQSGYGTLARLAIQRAHHADPADPLIHAIAECVRHGVHPDTLHHLLHD